VIPALMMGFLLGLRHSADADHVVAVSNLVGEDAALPVEGRGLSAARIGALWGLGHLLAVVAAGSVLMAMRWPLPPVVEWSLELLVAFVLVGLGVRTLWKCIAGRYHFHWHCHGRRWWHAHLHYHSKAARHEHHSHLFGRAGACRPDSPDAGQSSNGREAAPPLMHTGMRTGPLWLGMVHGLAGTAGLALLVLASIPTRLGGMLYLLSFGAGALVGMAAFSAVLAWPLGRAPRGSWWLDGVRITAGAANAALGAFLIYRAFLP
jgi:hypothetical protein